MGILSIITKLRKNYTMSSEKISPELLDRLNDRFDVVCKTIGEFNRRRAYYAQVYGVTVMDEVFKQLSIEKAKLDIQMEMIKNFLSE